MKRVAKSYSRAFQDKIKRIDGNAVAAETRAGVEGHEAEGLGGGGVDDFPDVDAHAQAEHFQLVDQRDVDAAEDVFEQLGHFRGAGRADGHDFGNDRCVDRDKRRGRWPD